MTNRIYAYTLVGKDNQTWERIVGQRRTIGEGLIKVGQTTKSSARARIKQQLGTAYPKLDGVTILLDEPASRPDGSEFTDHDVHHALVARGMGRPGGEWFEATLDEVKVAINAVRTGKALDPLRTQSFAMRPEQRRAVEMTARYFREHGHATPAPAPRFLWNAKMRFGKTFTAYQLAQEMDWRRVLVLTFKPAVKTAWRDDLLNHVDFVDWAFVDRDTDPVQRDAVADPAARLVWFASFQDLGGRTGGGQVKAHNKVIHETDWDCIVIDEYHFGAWSYTARSLYEGTGETKEADASDLEAPEGSAVMEDLGLTTAHCLYLSGTPFRAITNGEFIEDAVFNWTYVNEQAAKAAWDESSDGSNPYRELPRMEVFAYEMGDAPSAYAADGEFNAFSLTEYFKATKPVSGATRLEQPGTFVFEDPTRVYEFLEMLRGKLSDQMKSLVVGRDKTPFPYAAAAFTGAVRHAVWYMGDVSACFAMRDLLTSHPYFGDFEVIVAAGNRAGLGAAAKPPVEAGIAAATKRGTGSITLTCGKLMTGVTVPEWGAIFMLRSLQSPESYFQAAFRVQSPRAYRDAEGNLDVLKETCYVFEFDPNRALALVAEYGIRLGSASGITPSETIGQLLDYLPIYAFAGGRMTPLDADAVMEWATAGIGATALAQRWNSPLLVDVNEHTLGKVLANVELMAALDQVEDFRAFVSNAEHVVTSTNLLKKAKREQSGELDPDQRKTQSEVARKRKEIREKLQKFLAKIPVFMYTTDFREEALKHVVESLDTQLFERVTGLTVDDFTLLCECGLFNVQHMDAAIYQFRSFERASLLYASENTDDLAKRGVGLWDRSLDADDS